MEIGFTKFSAALFTVHDSVASRLLDEDHWRIVRSFRYYVGHLGSDRWVDVPVGYLSDGASVPRILWSLLPPWGEYGQAAVLHDYLCERPFVMTINGPVEVTRAEIDAILYEAMEVLKVTPWKALTIRKGVELNRALKRGAPKPVNPTKAYLQTDDVIISDFLTSAGFA